MDYFAWKEQVASQAVTTVLDDLSVVELGQLPKRSAIYFLYDGERLVYIGETKNLQSRWHSHHLKHVLKREEASLRVLFVTVHRRKLLEQFLILLYKPEYNIRVQCGPIMEHLTSLLKRVQAKS